MKPRKREVYNFKRANWDQLNRDIGSIDWPQFIDCLEPELAWNRFKEIFVTLVNRSIPKIKINGNFSSPWFDSECYEAYRSKERAHIKFKSVPSVSNELKRDATRKNFKNVCSVKMRENLYNRDDPVLITKKFWSHVKSNSKSTRIPECVQHKGRYRSIPKQNVTLIISEASTYAKGHN